MFLSTHSTINHTLDLFYWLKFFARKCARNWKPLHRKENYHKTCILTRPMKSKDVFWRFFFLIFNGKFRFSQAFLIRKKKTTEYSILNWFPQYFFYIPSKYSTISRSEFRSVQLPLFASNTFIIFSFVSVVFFLSLHF